MRALQAPLVTSLRAGLTPGFPTSVNENVPVAFVAVSVVTVITPLPCGPAAIQLSVGDNTKAPVSRPVAPTICVPSCAGVLKASVFTPGLPGFPPGAGAGRVYCWASWSQRAGGAVSRRAAAVGAADVHGRCTVGHGPGLTAGGEWLRFRNQC